MNMRAVKGRILVVDDEADILTLLRYNLEKAGFDVLSAQDGPEVLSIARRELPDLVILDIMLPSMDGTEVCRMLKKDELTAGIPIIMLTAKGEEIDKIVGLELGAEDYITKPFSPRELVLRVKAILKRVRFNASESDIISAGHVTMDSSGSVVMLDGSPLNLTVTECKLLFALVKSGGRVLSRDRLLDLVWGTECYVTDRTVDTHVRRLRKKLGDCSDCIETVRGFGYRFRVEI